MGEQDMDATQHRLLAELDNIDMPQELRTQLEGVVRQWIEHQRAVERLWDLHNQPKNAS